jgi:hypothetical protein
MSTAILNTGLNGTTSMPHLRLTRRGRAVLTVLVALAIVVAGLLVVLNGGGAAASNGNGGQLHYVTVQGGETLWQLAGEVAPKADPREVVADIVALNQLSTSDIQAGQRIAIPGAYAGK